VPLKAPPRIKVVPEVVEALDFLLARILTAKAGDGLDLGEAGFARKDGREGGTVLASGDGGGVGDRVFDGFVDRVELASALGVGEGLVGCGSARGLCDREEKLRCRMREGWEVGSGMKVE
jgi:hypothetical protein